MGFKSVDKQKPKHRKGLWSPEEDARLQNYVLRHSHGCWSSVPINAGLQRNGKSCRLRWINYLRPGLKRGMFSLQEEETILSLHRMLGNKWSQIAQNLPGRTDNEIKNYWHSYLKKRVIKGEEMEAQAQKEAQYFNSNSYSTQISTSPKKSKFQIPNFDSLEFTEGSSTDTDQSIPLNVDFPREAKLSSLPKLIFTEWLSLDHMYNKNVVNSSENAFSEEVVDHNSNFDDVFLDAFLPAADIFPEFELKDQNLENGFLESISSDEICNHFNVGGDVLY